MRDCTPPVSLLAVAAGASKWDPIIPRGSRLAIYNQQDRFVRWSVRASATAQTGSQRLQGDGVESLYRLRKPSLSVLSLCIENVNSRGNEKSVAESVYLLQQAASECSLTLSLGLQTQSKVPIPLARQTEMLRRFDWVRLQIDPRARSHPTRRAPDRWSCAVGVHGCWHEQAFV